MKTIINNKKYNTETARFVGSDAYGLPGDFSHWEESLYCKRGGEYFLHGEGGPMSRYAQSKGQNEWSGGEKIQPLDYQSAAEWAQAHLSADVYEKEFGEVSEDDGNTTITFSLPAAAADRIRRSARDQGQSVSAWILQQLGV